jgi:hypothetical protein
VRSDAPLGLLPFLAIALLFRLPAVCFARGYEFLDQQFQYVDPAWHLATGADWYRPWEWHEGIRSILYPAALAGAFRAGRALGVPAPEALLAFARLAHALLALVPMAAVWLAITRWRSVPGQRQVLLWVASSFLVVYPPPGSRSPACCCSSDPDGSGRCWPVCVWAWRSAAAPRTRCSDRRCSARVSCSGGSVRRCCWRSVACPAWWARVSSICICTARSCTAPGATSI